MLAASLEVLRKANVPPDQALAFVQVIGMEFDARGEVLATRQDVLASKHELVLKIESVKSELVRWTFTCMLGQPAILVGAGYFLINSLARSPR